MIEKWVSPGKLNLFLYIIKKRSDNYHMLQTLFQLIDYSDDISISITNDSKIVLLSNIYNIIQNNLIIHAAKLLQYYFWPHGNTPGAIIYLHKILPIGSDLRRELSNTAIVLIALNKQWNIQVNLNILAKLGLKLRADIPLFIYGITSFTEGIGDKLTPINYPKKWYLIIKLPICIFTKLIFSHYKPTKFSSKRSLIQLFNTSFKNDCEPIVRKIFPIINHCFLWLSQYIPIKLIGTSFCVFTDFNYKESALQTQKLLPSCIRSIIYKRINISPLYHMINK